MLEDGALDLDREYEEITAQLGRMAFGVLADQSCNV